MILSRTLARRRIATGRRPGWFAAWAPVVADALCLVLAYLLLWHPFRAITTGLDLPVWGAIVALFVILFIPIQGVLIFSSLWATRSRWIEEGKDDR